MHEYAFVPAKGVGASPVVLLHGSDGRETDLLPLAEGLMPSAAKISFRGAVATSGGFAFFRRRGDRRIDEVDLAARISPLLNSIRTALSEHGLLGRPIVLGYSNGAVMATALLQATPEVFSGAILLRALSPLTADSRQPLNGLPVLLLDGAHDERRASGDGQVLADALRRAGADVEHEVLPTGHFVGDLDKQIASRWLQRTTASKG